jgi:hypothetical protein
VSAGPARPWRSWLASLVWVLGALCALCLAVGALLVGLHADQRQPVPGAVTLLVRAADRLTGGRVVDLHGRNAAVKEVLLTWSLAAVGYLAAAKVADRVLRGAPRRGGV